MQPVEIYTNRWTWKPEDFTSIISSFIAFIFFNEINVECINTRPACIPRAIQYESECMCQHYHSHCVPLRYKIKAKRALGQRNISIIQINTQTRPTKCLAHMLTNNISFYVFSYEQTALLLLLFLSTQMTLIVQKRNKLNCVLTMNQGHTNLVLSLLGIVILLYLSIYLSIICECVCDICTESLITLVGSQSLENHLSLKCNNVRLHGGHWHLHHLGWNKQITSPACPKRT